MHMHMQRLAAAQLPTGQACTDSVQVHAALLLCTSPFGPNATCICSRKLSVSMRHHRQCPLYVPIPAAVRIWRLELQMRAAGAPFPRTVCMQRDLALEVHERCAALATPVNTGHGGLGRACASPSDFSPRASRRDLRGFTEIGRSHLKSRVLAGTNEQDLLHFSGPCGKPVVR